MFSSKRPSGSRMQARRVNGHARESILALAVFLVVSGCDRQPPVSPAAAKSTPAAVRASRRAYHGAPPVIPHPPLSGACSTCHTRAGSDVPGIGVAPANPHLQTMGLSDRSRCRQCHVFVQTTVEFRESDFQGLPASAGKGLRAHPLAPPVLPHAVFMYEDCLACHAGVSARADFVCRHAERTRCSQCHVPQTSFTEFVHSRIPSDRSPSDGTDTAIP